MSQNCETLIILRICLTYKILSVYLFCYMVIVENLASMSSVSNRFTLVENIET